MDQSGEKYAVLYVSDPFKIRYPSYREVERFLAESTNATGCGEVCKIKSSLLEGLLVVSSAFIISVFIILLMTTVDGLSIMLTLSALVIVECICKLSNFVAGCNLAI